MNVDTYFSIIFLRQACVAERIEPRTILTDVVGIHLGGRIHLKKEQGVNVHVFRYTGDVTSQKPVSVVLNLLRYAGSPPSGPLKFTVKVDWQVCLSKKGPSTEARRSCYFLPDVYPKKPTSWELVARVHCSWRIRSRGELDFDSVYFHRVGHFFCQVEARTLRGKRLKEIRDDVLARFLQAWIIYISIMVLTWSSWTAIVHTSLVRETPSLNCLLHFSSRSFLFRSGCFHRSSDIYILTDSSLTRNTCPAEVSKKGSKDI